MEKKIRKRCHEYTTYNHSRTLIECLSDHQALCGYRVNLRKAVSALLELTLYTLGAKKKKKIQKQVYVLMGALKGNTNG